MPNSPLRIIFIGDIVGRPGRAFLKTALPAVRKKFQPSVIIANGENSAGGLGLISKTVNELKDAGVAVITSGNHVWDKKEALTVLEEDPQVIRPCNYPDTNPGKGICEFYTEDNVKGIVINLQGRVFMDPVVDNPFLKMDEILKTCDSKVIFVDFHAEATAEKQAMGYYLDGRVSAVIGTHTHIPTADIRILEKGTAYQSDAGMTGVLNSVIGMKREPIIARFLTGIHHRFEVDNGECIMDFSIIDIDPVTGKSVKAESMRLYSSGWQEQLGV